MFQGYGFGTVPVLQPPLEFFMATIVKTPSGSWKAVIRKTGWPTYRQDLSYQT